MNRPVTILYSHASSLVGGGNKVLLRIIEGLDRRRFEPFSVIPDAGPMEDELRQRSVPCFVLDLRATGQTMPRQALSIAQLALRSLRLRPQLIHANETLYRSTSLGMPGAKRICHIHHPGSTAKGLRWLFRRIPDLVVTPSEFVKQEVLSCAAECGISIRVEAVHNPIDVDWFRPPPDRGALLTRLDLDPGERHVSILGALAPHKGHGCFLRMARRIVEEIPETRFHIVGGDMGRDGSHRRRLEQLAEELDIAGRVQFWGYVDDHVARDILAASDLFVLPTTEEGFGLVVAEAQACQVPVLTSAIRPLDEVVDDGRTGYLIEPGDDFAFARRAVELLRSESARRAMGAAGRAWVDEHFSLESYVGRLMALYDELLATRKHNLEQVS